MFQRFDEVSVPRIKSAKKRMRQARARAEHNRAQRSAVRTAVKKARVNTNKENVSEAIRVLDKGARKGVLHRNAAARRKSRLMKKLSKTA